MNSIERGFQLDLAAARYLEALDREDFSTMAELWASAAGDEALESALREIHAGVVEEAVQHKQTTITEGVVAAVEHHLPSAEIVRQTDGPITVADVAEELSRNFVGQLPIDALLLHEQLRTSPDVLPNDLGMSALAAWAQERFGSASLQYWSVFRQAAVKLELRRAAEADYSMAARRGPKPEGGA